MLAIIHVPHAMVLLLQIAALVTILFPIDQKQMIIDVSAMMDSIMMVLNNCVVPAIILVRLVMEVQVLIV